MDEYKRAPFASTAPDPAELVDDDAGPVGVVPRCALAVFDAACCERPVTPQGLEEIAL